MEKNKERTERELKNLHPLLSRIKPWLKRQLKRADADHASQHTWDAHIKAIGTAFHKFTSNRFKKINESLAYRL